MNVSLRELLRASELARHRSAAELSQLADTAPLRALSPGEPMGAAGAPLPMLYCVLHGEIYFGTGVEPLHTGALVRPRQTLRREPLANPMYAGAAGAIVAALPIEACAASAQSVDAESKFITLVLPSGATEARLGGITQAAAGERSTKKHAISAAPRDIAAWLLLTVFLQFLLGVWAIFIKYAFDDVAAHRDTTAWQVLSAAALGTAVVEGALQLWLARSAARPLVTDVLLSAAATFGGTWLVACIHPGLGATMLLGIAAQAAARRLRRAAPPRAWRPLSQGGIAALAQCAVLGVGTHAVYNHNLSLGAFVASLLMTHVLHETVMAALTAEDSESRKRVEVDKSLAALDARTEGHKSRAVGKKLIGVSAPAGAQKEALWGAVLHDDGAVALSPRWPLPPAGERVGAWLGRQHGDSALARCLTLACADDVIACLPQGLWTRVRPGDRRLSQSARVRLHIASVLLQQPRTWVLDETLDCCDSALANTLLTNIRRALPDTQVVLATRFSSLLGRCELVVRSDTAHESPLDA